MEVSQFAACYFYIVAKQHLATSMAFTSSLPDSLKADSISAFDLTDTSSVSTSSKKGHPPKDKFFNKLAVSAMKFFDEVLNETTGLTSIIKEYNNLILHYQGSILEMYKQKAQLSDEAEIGNFTEMIKASQGMSRDAHAQCEFWVMERDEECGGIPKFATASSLTMSSNEDISPLTTSSACKMQREEISHQQNGTEESSTSDED